mmetsp:Transcript_19095/g.26095  ORF Transcript_19095/g.26095 Transcript_19095/m.26095 type:complete len:122 (-) Transcript_19095:50-415(-)
MTEEEELLLRNSQVEECLSKKDKANALRICLDNPPVNSKSEDIKDGNFLIVEKVLLAITDAEIHGLIHDLSPDACDVLMKYIYKFMGKCSNSALMLKLHSQLLEKAGIGSIVRVLTDRKMV